ncbi:MAG: DUF4340 domain-containing protein [Cyanobacteria bacterium REEB65]|nr:DUF4340 domain-containing protein [Cyanobacteria bacterium REEB65]
MKWQTTAALAAITLVVGGYIWLVDSKQDAPPADGTTVYMWDMSDADADPITKVVATEGTRSVTFVKLPPQPTPKPAKGATPDPLATPPQATWHEADKTGLPLTYTWDSAWGDLQRLQADRIVAKHPGPGDTDINDFSSPSVTVTLGTDKSARYTLLVGKKTISGNGYYAKMANSPTIYEIAGYKVDNFKKLVDDPPVASPTPAPTPTPTPKPTVTPAPLPGLKVVIPTKKP